MEGLSYFEELLIGSGWRFGLGECCQWGYGVDFIMCLLIVY